MNARFSAPLTIIATLAAGMAAAEAGPCSKQIAAFEQSVRTSEKNPDAGPTGREGVAAKLGHQPTRESVAQAEQRANETFRQALARAKALDARGKRSCMQALSRAKDLFDLQ